MARKIVIWLLQTGDTSDVRQDSAEIQDDASAPDGMMQDAPDPPAPSEWNPADFTNVYEVGPDYPYENPSEVPWESLGADTLVLIHHRPEPYRDKGVINTTATESDPLVVLGVPGPGGELPVIDGDNATTRAEITSTAMASAGVSTSTNHTRSGVTKGFSTLRARQRGSSPIILLSSLLSSVDSGLR